MEVIRVWATYGTERKERKFSVLSPPKVFFKGVKAPKNPANFVDWNDESITGYQLCTPNSEQ